MKRRGKRWLSLLLSLALLAGFCPAQALAAEMVTPISTVEEFMEIMDRPDGSYRLENDLDLGLIAPLDRVQENGFSTSFTGSLDGNGHTIRYRMEYVENCWYYGLFRHMSGAEVTNLTVDADIDITPPEDAVSGIYIGIVAGAANNGTALTGSTIRADIRYEDDSTNRYVNIEGVLGNYGCVLHTVDVDWSVQARGGSSVNFTGLASVYSESYNCTVSGEVSLTGKRVYASLLLGAEDSVVDMDAEAFASTEAYIYGARSCTNVCVYGDYAATAAENGGAYLYGLSSCTDSVFEGTLASENSGDVYGLSACTDSVFAGHIETAGTVFHRVRGLHECTDSVFEGLIETTHSAYGIQNSEGCSFDGGIYGANELYGIYMSSGSLFRGDLVCSGSKLNTAACGISGCTDSSFEGTVYNDRGESANAYGINGSDNCSFDGSIYSTGTSYGANGNYSSRNTGAVIHADIYGTWAEGLVWMKDSSFEGTLAADLTQGSVTVLDSCSDSISKAAVSGRSVTVMNGASSAASEGNYHTGDIYATHDVDLFSDTTGCAVRSNILVESDDEGYLHTDDGSNGYSGTAVCYAQSYLAISGADVSGYMPSRGLSVSTRNGNQEYRDHYPYCAAFSDISKRCDALCPIYAYVTSVGGTDIGEIPFGSVDPDKETLEPEEDENAEPRTYTVRLLDMDGAPVPEALITMSGVEYETDESGCVTVTDGPSVVSPLEVALWDEEEEEYFTVLTRTAYYPMPGRVNDLRLEPQLEFELTALESGDGVLGEGTAAGFTATVMGKPLDLLSFKIDFSIEELFGETNPLLQVKHDKGSGSYIVYLGKKGDLRDPSDLSSIKTTYKNVDDPEKRKMIRFSGMDGYVGVGLFAELDVSYDPWAMSVEDSGIVLLGSLSGRQVYPLAIVPPMIPVYGTVALQAELTIEGSLETGSSDDGSEDRLQLHTKSVLEGSVEAAIGAGARLARAYVEGGVSGVLTPALETPMESLEDGLTVDVKGSAFVEARFLNMTTGRINLLESDPIRIWPQQSAVNMYSLSRAAMGAEYSVLSRDYAAAEPMTLEDETVYMGLDEGSYPYAEVSLTPLSDGRYLLVYTDDDLSRAAADRSTLRACIGWEADDGTLRWGEAVTVEDDGTADFGFDVGVSGTTAAILWQDAAETFGDGNGLTTEEAAASVALSQTMLDCSGEIPVADGAVTVAAAGSMPYHPTLFYDGYTLRAAWVTTTNPDPSVYTADETETVWLAEDGETAAVAEGQVSISGLALTYESLLWTEGAEGEMALWNYEDSALSQLEEGTVLYLQSRNNLFGYVKDEVFYRGSNGSDIVRAGEGEGYANVLQLSADGEVYAAQPGTENSRVCIIEDGKALPIGSYEGYLSSWDAANGHIVSVLRQGFNADGGTVTASFVNAPAEEVVAYWVGTAVCGNRLAAPGSQVTLRIPVFNDGYGTIDSLPVSVVAEDGTVLFGEDVSCAVEAGSTQEITVSFTVPDGFTAQEVTISVGEQRQSLLLGGSNLALSAEWAAYDAGTVRAEVSNTGIGEVSGRVRLTDEHGAVLGEQSVTVAENGCETVCFALEDYYAEPATLRVTLTEPAGHDESDNTATVRVEPVTARKIFAGEALSLAVNESAPLPLRCFPSGSLLPEMSYQVADGSVAQVDKTGTVKALKAGQTTVTATAANGEVYTTTVTVGGVSLAISEPFQSVYRSAVLRQEGDEFTLQITGTNAAPESLTVWVAQYDAAGRMTEVTTVSGEVSGKSVVFAGELPDRGRLFLVNKDLQPVIEAVDIPF